MAEASASRPRPFRVVIVGAGRIGTALGLLLREKPEFEILLVDPTEPARRRAEGLALPFAEVDPSNAAHLDRVLAGADAVVAAVPSSATPLVAAAARRSGTHYLDLGDDGAALEAVRREADAAQGSFVAQCGISPGLVSSLVLDLAAQSTAPADIDVRIASGTTRSSSPATFRRRCAGALPERSPAWSPARSAIPAMPTAWPSCSTR